MKTKTKGLEPIVAAVLLIVVAVIGAALVYFWFAGYVTKATSQAESMAASERLKIEAASLTADTGEATLYIRNIGGYTVRLVHAYVLKPGSISPVCSVEINPAATIDAGMMSPITVDLTNCDIDAGYDYVIKIVTQKGTEFAVTVTAS
jgi:FlaG/FlaF family flagellin (archaellin)